MLLIFINFILFLLLVKNSSLNINKCLGLPETFQQSCVNEVFKNLIDKNGVENSFAVMDKLSQNEPLFYSQGCFYFSFLIGQKAYDEINQGKKISLNSYSFLCNYGFYRGLISKIKTTKGGLNNTSYFCNYLNKYGKGIDCYYGIGNALVKYPPDESNWGKPSSLIYSAINGCKQITGANQSLNSCISGVFNFVLTYMDNNNYGMHYESPDPLSFCRNINKNYQNICYITVAQRLGYLTGYNIEKINALLTDIKDANLKRIMLETSVSAVFNGRGANYDLNTLIVGCSKIGKDLQTSCFEGIINGLSVNKANNKNLIGQICNNFPEYFSKYCN